MLNKTSTTAPPATPPASGNCGTSLLIWTFTIFNFLRILAYLPTIEAILVTGESDQHSLVTWLIFFGANVTMCCWLYEEAGRRFNQAGLTNCGNALMCGVICLLIVWTRLPFQL